jgi:hypothetical protein
MAQADEFALALREHLRKAAEQGRHVDVRVHGGAGEIPTRGPLPQLEVGPELRITITTHGVEP